MTSMERMAGAAVRPPLYKDTMATNKKWLFLLLISLSLSLAVPLALGAAWDLLGQQA